jgi:hypothetical protein
MIALPRINRRLAAVSTESTATFCFADPKGGVSTARQGENDTTGGKAVPGLRWTKGSAPLCYMNVAFEELTEARRQDAVAPTA